MNEMMEMNRKAQQRFEAYNAKISELQPRMREIEKDKRIDEFESDEYAVLCAMLSGLMEQRDKEQDKHHQVIQEMAPEWDGD